MKTFILILLFPIALFADSVQSSFFLLNPLTSGTIPTSAKGWTVSVITGSATVGSQTLYAGTSFTDRNQPLSGIVVSSGTNSIVYYRYNQ